jgi:raffinose/stachyose/melibiose transport system permease protein
LSPPGSESRGGRLFRGIRRGSTGYLFIAVPLALYGLFVLVPLANAVYYSLTSWNGADPIKDFIGLDNYHRMLNDPQVWGALLHNATWIILGSIGGISISLLMAVLVSRNRMRGLFSTAYFLPVLLASAAVGVIWGHFYAPDGLINRILELVGLSSLASGWLGNPDTALFAVLIAGTWAGVGFSFVIFLAALRNVDQDLLDAASVDGAGAWPRFRNVVMPQIRTVMKTVIILYLISGFTAFDLVYIMTQGGPAWSTELIATYGHRKAFRGSEVGYGAAITMLITVLALATSVIYMRIFQRDD